MMAKTNKIKLPAFPKVLKDFIVKILKMNNIKQVSFEFNGYGDEGNIEDIAVDPEKYQVVLDSDEIHIPSNVLNSMLEEFCENESASMRPGLPTTATQLFQQPFFGGKEWADGEVCTIRRFFEKLTTEVVYHRDFNVDWVNGEGGSGCIIFKIVKNSLKVKVLADEYERVPVRSFETNL